MAKGDPNKPKGKMSAYAFFVQTCREAHKKKNPEVSVNFAEFSKKCSERWTTMPGKEKSKFLFCSEFRPKIKSTNPGISIGDVAKKLGEMWNNLNDSEKQPYITKAAKLKEKYEKDVADYKSKGKFDGAKGPAKVARKKVLDESYKESESSAKKKRVTKE
ncbi:hypothetical protein EGM_17820, partial [Macaca fascicularis]